jgi:gliding motility-associated-like protein
MIIKLHKIGSLFLFLSLYSQFSLAQPKLTAEGDQSYCPLSEINVVTDFDILNSGGENIQSVYIQISTGYDFGYDLLTLAGNHPSIITSWSATEGKLTLTASSTATALNDLITAVKNVVFKSTSNNPTNKFFSFTIGDANYLPKTRHYYQYVPDLGITWSDAKVAAESKNYYGLQGYLATILYPEEAQLAGEQAAGAGWIGGSDAQTEGVWKWVTGPEGLANNGAGTIFWNGVSNGSTPNYANWNSGEPNNLGNEDYAHVTYNVGIKGSWNDLSNTGDLNPGNYQPKGYIVEYGGMPGETALNISASTQISVTKISSTIPNSSCGAGSVVLEAFASTPTATILWYENVTGEIFIGSGNQLTTPVINISTTYYALASENGCLTGVRTPVLATINTIPIISSATDKIVCESGSGTLTATASAGVVNWYNSPSGGSLVGTGNSYTTPILNTTTVYYVDATSNGCTTPTRVPVTLTVQKTPLPTANVTQTFCDIQNAKISDLSVSGLNILWYINSSGGSPLNTSELLSNNIYYATQTINTCESPTRLPVSVIIYETVVPITSSNIPNLEVCDSMLDGDDTNGFEIFDLTLNESVLLNGKSASDYTFSYFTDASYSIPIPNPSTFVNTLQSGQTIYVKIENNLNTTCFTEASFNIVINKLPIIQSNIIFKNCDEDGSPDGFTNYNLNEANDVISYNNAVNLTFSYYATWNDAVTGLNPLNASFYNNINGNTVYARVENVHGCYRISIVNLQVSTTSFPLGYIQELENCDDDTVIDGFREFNLSNASISLLSNFPLGQNLSVHYFRNLNDAQLEQNEILNQTSYVNETAFSQVLYVRVESDDNGECFGLGPHVLLTVHPRPEFEVDNSAIYCLDNNPITLTTFNPKGNYTYEWIDGNGQIVSNSSFATVVSGGSYTVMATSSFGCESFPLSFTVVESAIASISLDDVSIVELSDNNSITINNDNNNLGIGDYEFALDNFNGPYQDQPYFDRVGAGAHTIYVKDKNLCGIVQLDVFILGFPKFFTPNNDGRNDTWHVKGLGNDFSNASIVSVFDRYGKLIKQLNAKNGYWDGTFNGQELANSDYWFVAELIEATGNVRTFRGHFTLKR